MGSGEHIEFVYIVQCFGEVVKCGEIEDAVYTTVWQARL